MKRTKHMDEKMINKNGKILVKVSELQKEEMLFKGIFWIADREYLENNEPYLFKIVTDRSGTF